MLPSFRLHVFTSFLCLSVFLSLHFSVFTFFCLYIFLSFLSWSGGHFEDGDLSRNLDYSGELSPNLDFSGGLSPNLDYSGELSPNLDISGELSSNLDFSGCISPNLAFSGGLSPNLDVSGGLSPNLDFSDTPSSPCRHRKLQSLHFWLLAINVFFIYVGTYGKQII